MTESRAGSCDVSLRVAAVLLVALIFSGVPVDVLASGNVRGKVTTYESPSGVREACVALEHMPGGSYTAEDTAEEAKLCGIDFHGKTHALCPKVFSTSPGTLVYDLRDGAYAGRREAFEREKCGGSVRKEEGGGEPISYKMSVNTRESSATFANSSLIYYHFAHYFDASVHVPVAVFRSIDRGEHGKRVSARGVELSAGRANLKMNHAAWKALRAAEQDPSSYTPTAELFTSEGLLYGVMLHPQGKRYSEEINGTRKSGWGDGQNRDFQETAPFRALRSDKPLKEAIEEGKRIAFKDPKIAKATGSDATPEQMVFWMADLVDITLLDFIFSQQDRIGNIDYLTFWYWVENGKVRRRPASSKTVPEDIAAHKPVYLKRTELGDNDAGVRTSYANYTKRTKMLEGLRHYRGETYRRLMRLDKDFRAGGPLHAYVKTTFGLSDRELAQVVANTGAAAEILRATCQAGNLRFDVDPEQFLKTGTVVPEKVSCEAP